MSQRSYTLLFKMSLWSAVIVAVIIFGFVASLAQQTFQEYMNQQDQEYNKYRRAEEEAFAKYKADVEKKWNEFVDATRRDWVEYSSDLNTLSDVDFEDGEITVETIVDKTNPDIMGQASKNIADKIAGLFTVDSLADEVVLANCVEFHSPPIIDSTNSRLFARERVLPGATIDRETIMSQDGIERVKITATFKMVPDHIKIRAQRYMPAAKKYCSKYNVELPLVMAIMQTESFFNPRAKSPIPAYGLMQLVPRSGAREAYRFVHKEDKIVKPDFLYTPENNIHLGCAYLAKMRDNEFKDVHDPDKLRFCLIAAYNTGPSNVFNAIAEERSMKPAIEEINFMDKDTLYRILKEELPYQETKDYLVKVETRREYYEEWR